MASNARGVQLPSALIRPTSPEPAPGLEPEDGAEPAEQGRGEARPAPRARARRPKATSEKTSKRGLYLTDATWERLQLESIRKKTSVSAIAGDILERNLPRLRIARDE